MTDPVDESSDVQPTAPPAPPPETVSPAERMKRERSARLASALRANLKRRKHPTSGSRTIPH